MKLAIMIPMGYRAAVEAGSLGVPGWTIGVRWAWPELCSGRPRLPAEIAAEVQKTIETWVQRKRGDAIIITRSEIAVLRAQRMVAEGAPIELTIHFPGSAHEPVTVKPDGEVTAWPEGLFSEDFEEVKAIRRAQQNSEDACTKS